MPPQGGGRRACGKAKWDRQAPGRGNIGVAADSVTAVTHLNTMDQLGSWPLQTFHVERWQPQLPTMDETLHKGYD